MTKYEITLLKQVLDAEYHRLQKKITQCRENKEDYTRYNTAQGSIVTIEAGLEELLGIDFD